MPNRTHYFTGEAGLVWIDDELKSGEAWDQGPVILSLVDVAAGGTRDGYNVVIHELAPKLDLLDGATNGHPPLHRGMSDAAWTRALGEAYEDLCAQSDSLTAQIADNAAELSEAAGPDALDELAIDPYATESPAGFFAVCSETFFELPHQLQATYPSVYQQLRAFYTAADISCAFSRGSSRAGIAAAHHRHLPAHSSAK